MAKKRQPVPQVNVPPVQCPHCGADHAKAKTTNTVNNHALKFTVRYHTCGRCGKRYTTKQKHKGCTAL